MLLGRDASYRTAIATEAFTHMDFALADAIAQTYSFHEFHHLYYDKTMDLMYAGGLNNLDTLRSTMNDMIAITRETLALDSRLSALIQKRVGSK